MSTAFFNTEAINLSMRSPETGAYLTSNVYTLEGVTNEDGSLRQMSVGQLVMAVCLNRATELEGKILELMNGMAVTTDRLELLSKAEAKIADWQRDNSTSETISNSALKTLLTDTVFADLMKEIEESESSSSYDIENLLKEIEEKMDSYNTISQKDLIEIQSLSSKRDDTYSLISNVLKSIYTVLTGNVNNL